ncbi:MAG: DUF4381 domain-containing protein [Sedimenticolaceae bacterium]|nr:DUF4381 domain-containing protein [Sedimenticolaceae bacterium]
MNDPVAESLQLRDIHLPPPPDFWPPAPGWWFVAAILVLLVAWILFLLWRRARLQRAQRRLLALLDELDLTGKHEPRKLAQLSILLRRIALMHYPRTEVAGLTGEAWLRFLDSSGGNGGFTRGPGHVLAEGPYMSELPGEYDPVGITALVRDWVRKNAGRRNGA